MPVLIVPSVAMVVEQRAVAGKLYTPLYGESSTECILEHLVAQPAEQSDDDPYDAPASKKEGVISLLLGRNAI